MPIYVYRAAGKGCAHCQRGFELLHGLREEPVQHCPECGAQVQRVPGPFSTGRGNVLSDGSLRDHGFQKLRRTEKGYRREV